MSSNALQIGSAGQNNTPSFVQNGQVDWVAFGNSLWSTSSAVLQRFASAGVQPVTYGAGIALASQFQLDRVGKQRMDNALNNLRGVSGFEKVLWFGFGVRSFLRVMADTELGIKCIALCACLAEVQGEDVSAWILEDLWKLHNYPQEYLPSHAQFVALVRACSGALTKTSFSKITDRMLGRMLDAYSTARHLPQTSNTEDVAKAIRGLFQISNGAISRISVTGGVGCAFIAAFASWLFNFKVYVEDEAGTVIYEDESREAARVVVTYSTEAALPLVQVSSTTYVLHELDDLWIRNPKLDQILLTFRTPWDGCLARVFGAAFDDLIKLPYILGGFLGSAARVYSGLAMAEKDVAQFSRKTYVNFVEACYGRGYVTAALLTFPELGRASNLLEVMQKAADASIEEALRTVEQTVHNLTHACNCSQCTSGGLKSEASCLLIMAISIREMISTISCTIRDPELLPTIRGIQCIYSDIANQVVQTIATSRVPHSIALGLGTEDMVQPELNIHKNIDLLSHQVQIFSGYAEHSRYFSPGDVLERDIRTAHVRQGLCYYLDCLHSMSGDLETMRMVHILPGHIQMGDRQFDNIYDPPSGSERSFGLPLTAIQYNMVEEHDPTAVIKERRFDNIEIKAFGMEKSTEHELVVFYEISIPGEPTIQFRPGSVTGKILRRMGIQACEQMSCSTQLAFPCALVQQGWQMTDSQRREIQRGWSTERVCCIWPSIGDVARYVVMSLVDEECLFLRRRECVSCCTKSIVSRQSLIRDSSEYHIL